jgi:hypothetical protein
MAATAEYARPVPLVNPWLIAATVITATFMEVLDTSVANVALPHIAGNLSAGVDDSPASDGMAFHAFRTQTFLHLLRHHFYD